ncbi:MAG TPA: hypothetical protein VGH14_17655 [Solirubrobacterales bacterium]
MPSALMVVGSNPVSAEREDAYNRWYVDTHFGDVLAVAGFTKARRYAQSPVRPMADTEPSPFGYLAIYEVEADDLAQAGRDLQAALDSGAIPISEDFDLTAFSVDFYEFVPGSERSA